ncbi:SPW repeat protein (plasmid) [Ensifer adhaerens]|uniref:SPW repeat protein n=1 Tax=Ensifer adhaerens TaxID=106592 RepID=UPI0023A9AEAD|nr:SPW repeat protein [Ensifer adhaerens]WDZ79341.1 SPW repeat protein [Ensifer adhaerens]
MKNKVPSTWLELTNLVIGFGFLCAAFAFVESAPALWSGVIVGSIITSCSIVALYHYQDWAEWTNLFTGFWAVIAPLVLGFGSTAAPMWTHVLVGLCVATVATMQLRASRRSR